MSAVASRGMLWIVLNWLLFGAVLGGALWREFGSGEFRVPLISDDVSLALIDDPVYTFVYIFIWNLIVSGFLVLSLSGLVFFALPFAFLLLRGFVWGELLNGLPTPLFVAALPTLLLEGEAYVLAGLTGIFLGLSWQSPKRMFKDVSLSRVQSFRRALRNCARVYVLVVLLLLVAALVETLTIFLF